MIGGEELLYTASWPSIRNHDTPEWFSGAKFGIIAHWGPSAIPAWAPMSGEMNRVVSERGWKYWFKNNAYAEWYLNSMKIKGSPTREHHISTYGKNGDYESFVEEFKELSLRCSSDSWSELFSEAGAKYVVLTAKHHDGFLLWPSKTPNPFKKGYQLERDFLGELKRSLEKRSIRMGIYYSGGLDWTFANRPIKSFAELLMAIPQTSQYSSYADSHWQELIEVYRPSILWNDIGYPVLGDLRGVLSKFYNVCPEGVVNDRFSQHDARLLEVSKLSKNPVTRSIISVILSNVSKRSEANLQDNTLYYDFRTQEYETLSEVPSYKWECVRGMGNSFGYNSLEDPHQTDPQGLLELLVDVVSKNGNLLLGVGARADGSIPESQEESLRTIGKWLKVFGDAIFNTEPWKINSLETTEGNRVYFTRKQEILFAVVFGPVGSTLTLKGLPTDCEFEFSLFQGGTKLGYTKSKEDFVIELGRRPQSEPFVIRMRGSKSCL